MKDLKIYADIIEDAAKEQIDLLLSQEAFKDAKVRIMPDVHAGKGCVIGFTAEFLIYGNPYIILRLMNRSKDNEKSYLCIIRK